MDDVSLLCPKCTNTMRQYERNDVIIDQCTECGGIFLDRGELERLAQAEANYYSPAAAQPLPARESRDDDRSAPRYERRGRPDSDRGYDPRFSRGYRHDSDRGFDPRYSRGYKHDSDRGYDPRYSGKYGKRRKKEGFFGEMLDLFD